MDGVGVEGVPVQCAVGVRRGGRAVVVAVQGAEGDRAAVVGVVAVAPGVARGRVEAVEHGLAAEVEDERVGVTLDVVPRIRVVPAQGGSDTVPWWSVDDVLVVAGRGCVRVRSARRRFPVVDVGLVHPVPVEVRRQVDRSSVSGSRLSAMTGVVALTGTRWRVHLILGIA